MPIVYVHGVAVRSDGYWPELSTYLRRYVARAISDQADEVLPAIMATFVDAEGQTKMSAVLAALILGRVRLGALLRAGGASRRAHQALLRCRGALAGLG